MQTRATGSASNQPAPRHRMCRTAAALLVVVATSACGIFEEPTVSAFRGDVRIAPPITTSMFIGQQQVLSAMVVEEDGTRSKAHVSWSVSDGGIAEFRSLSLDDQVVLTALKAGTVTVTAQVAGQTDAVTITVRPPGPVVRIVVPTSVRMVEGDTYQLLPVLRDSNGVALAAPVAFTSSDTSVVAVSAKGEVRSIRGGSATIAVSSASLVAMVQLTVRVWSHAFLWTASDGMRDLGNLNGFAYSVAHAINAAGQVVGESGKGGPLSARAFRWTPSAGMVELVGLVPQSHTTALAINGGGTVAGAAMAADGFLHAVVWAADGSIRDLGTLPGEPAAWAVAIDDAGRVFGGSGDQAFVWTAADGMKPLPPPWSYAWINQVAATGVAVGGAWEGDLRVPLSWNATLDPRVLPFPPGASVGGATAINGRGDVIGWSGPIQCLNDFASCNVVLWPAVGSPIDLGPSLGGAYPTGLNASGQVAGSMRGRAFVWSAGGGVRDLGMLPYSDASYATGINDAGQVIGASSCTPCETQVVP